MQNKKSLQYFTIWGFYYKLFLELKQGKINLKLYIKKKKKKVAFMMLSVLQGRECIGCPLWEIYAPGASCIAFGFTLQRFIILFQLINGDSKRLSTILELIPCSAAFSADVFVFCSFLTLKAVVCASSLCSRNNKV